MLDLMDSSRVDRMIIQGRRIVDAAIAQFNPVGVFAAFSGGNDSVVTTHFACEHYGAAAIHCDTSVGLDVCRDHVVSCARRFGWDLRVLPAVPEGPPRKTKAGLDFDVASLPSGRWDDGGTAYEEYCFNFGMPGPAQHHRMFQRLKQRPIARFQREVKRCHPRTATMLIVSGIRGDESSVRAGYKRDTQKEQGTSRVWVNPFYWNTSVDFEAYRQEFGLPRNPVKDCIGVSGECNCGSFAGDNEIARIRTADPGFAHYLEGIARRAQTNGFPWDWGCEPPAWWRDSRQGQMFLFEPSPNFRPMCVGCRLRK